MNKFIKWPKIRNHYDGKYLGKGKYCHGYNETKWIVTEKLDGSNFQVIITPNSIDFASRNQMLNPDDNFFEYQEVMHSYREEFMRLTRWMMDNYHVQINLFGELYGPGIQRRIDYGKEKKFLPFGMYIDGYPVPIKRAVNILNEAVGETWFVPIEHVYNTLEEALEHDVEGRDIEGVVIAPLDFVLVMGDDGLFRVKKKSKSFCDKSRVKHKELKVFEGSELYYELSDIWKSYINQNRLLDLFSKQGMILDMKEVGLFIKLMIDDVREDFFEEHKEAFITLPKEEQKKIIGQTASVVVPLLKKAIAGEFDDLHCDSGMVHVSQR